MSRYLTPRTVFITIKLFVGLRVLLYFHSVRWDLHSVSTVTPLVQQINVDKNCPRCQVPTHVLFVFTRLSIIFLSSTRFYTCLQLHKILGSQFLNSTF